MKNQTFEPGPWILGGCSGRMITTPDGYVGDGFIADVDTLANARLIASAPELLEALQDAEKALFAALDNAFGEELANGNRQIIQARKAIAKALGQ